MPDKDKYITPITKVYSTFSEAKDFYDKYGGIEIFDDKDPRLTPKDLAHGTRNLVVGEPGVGKSLLLGRIHDHLAANGYATALINLRLPDVEEQIDVFLKKKSSLPKALFLDALDEVQSSRFPSVLQKLEKISRENSKLSVYISSRWIFINRYAISFPDFRFLVVCPFTQGQVRDYLSSYGHSEKEVSELLQHTMSFSHRMMVIQIPRYLSYFEDFLKKNNIDIATKASRNDLFEHFIYRKLDQEDQTLQADKKAIVKRILEKLALTMEIYQTNVLTKDELMTFFDEIKSDLKLVALAQIDLESLYDHSIIKNNIDTIEFDNSEFQEYLAAKEISRMPDPNRAAFGFAVDTNVKEIYSTWFNTLTFLVDMQPDLLGQLVDFSGIRITDTFKIMDDGFLAFLSRVNPHSISPDLRQELFRTVIDYHTRAGQWIPGELTSALPGFFESVLEDFLKSAAAEAEKKTGSGRFVPLGNIAYVVAYLLKNGASLDKPFWREKLLTYAADTNENGVLQRHALLAFEYFGDPTIIDELAESTEPDELVSQGFLSVYKELDPDHPKSLEAFFLATRRNNIHGRYGILALTKRESLKAFLEMLAKDPDFRREFLDDSRIFKDRDQEIVDHIAAIMDDEIKDLAKQALVASVDHYIASNVESSVFLLGLWKLLRAGDPDFVLEMVKRIRSSPDAKNGLYFALPFFAATMQVEDVPKFIDAMNKGEDKWSAFSTMQTVRYSKRDDAEAVYEAGRSELAEDYKAWEERQKQPDNSKRERDESIVKEFKALLEPEKGKFSYGVFDFYNHHKDTIDPLISKEEKDRLATLITGTIFKLIDPAKHELKMTAMHDSSRTYTTSQGVHTFGDALITAKHLGIDIAPFRQHIIDFIPFAYTDALRVLFELVKNITPTEMGGVMNVYRLKQSDLWRHMPSSFVEAVEQYHVSEAVPVLREFVKEPEWDGYVREHALQVADALGPNPAFLKEINELYRTSKDQKEKKLSDIASGLLVTNHGDGAAVRSRLQEIVTRAVGYRRAPGLGVHNIGDIEEEIHWGKSFAKPLMDLKHPGYEGDFLDLLEKAMGVWSRGIQFQDYASYMWGIVYAYFDNLKERRSYEPLRLLEQKIAAMKDRDGANWLAAQMVNLRRSYLAYLGKPRNVSEAVRRYNRARDFDDKKIVTSDDFFEQLKDALEKDLRRWIEGEGGYSLIIGENVLSGKRKQYEKFIQRTLKTEVDNIMRKRGFEVDLLRETELLDGKKVDFWVKYGFVGPIVIEIKLTSNKDLQGADLTKAPSHSSMARYVEGFSATHGILLVIDNTNSKKIQKIKEAYQKIPRVWVQSFDCNKKMDKTKPSTKKRAGKKKSRSRRH
jgi:GTPase SAR1 family protein